MVIVNLEKKTFNEMSVKECAIALSLLLAAIYSRITTKHTTISNTSW